MTALDSAHRRPRSYRSLASLRCALGPVLGAQRREWLEQLAWDIAEITDFVGTAIRARSLRGLALVADDDVVGFAF
jgi:hypothetical protein